MGSRIHIKLDHILGNKNLKVEIATATDGFVEATITDQSGRIDGVLDEVVFSYDGKGELSGDFNFFRSPEDHGKVMRFLFEHGIDFTVLH